MRGGINVGVKRSVFGSGPERANYYKLRKAWGTSCHIFPNLPFLHVFSVDGLELSDTEKANLKKTNIDYTLCNKKADRPLVCVEFDGLYDGVNIGSHYYPGRGPASDWRELILSLKVRVAHAERFPFFVVGTDFFKDLSSELKLTIVDGIIGEALAHEAQRSRFAGGLHLEESGLSDEAFEQLDPDARQAVVDYLGDSVQVRARLNHNPIYARAMRLTVDLSPLGSVVTFRQFPEGTASPLYVGTTVAVNAPDCGEIIQTAMLPCFDTPGFPFEYSLTESIATLCCLEQVAQSLVL
jgi:hypothetical protein